MAQTVKNLPAMQETQVRYLDGEDPLEIGMTTHSSILAWKIPWREEPGGPQSMGWQRLRQYRVTHTHRYLERYVNINAYVRKEEIMFYCTAAAEPLHIHVTAPSCCHFSS